METKNAEAKQLDGEEFFYIPIRHNECVQKLNPVIVKDLEFIHRENAESDTPTYHQLFYSPTNHESAQVLRQQAEYYTTDTKYLKDTQHLTQHINSIELNTIRNKHNVDDFKTNEMVELWNEIKGDTGFCEKYLFVDWSFAKHLNKNHYFLQLMSLYNITSPILSLCMPIFILIVPLIVIKFKGIELQINDYLDILKQIISNHSVFKIFTQFHSVNNEQKAYLLISASFYLFSIYQNILICVRFYSNIQKIHTYLLKIKKYISYQLDVMQYYSTQISLLSNRAYTQFLEKMNEHQRVLVHLHEELCKITPFRCSLFKIAEIGHVMKTFYEIYDNDEYNKSMKYSFGFNSYFNMLCHIGIAVQNGKMHNATFISKKTVKPKFKGLYYPNFINNEDLTIVKNDCDLSKNFIITGPNASGKTTLLKSILMNVILSQQIGVGCFEKLKMTPYDQFHCYLNIPDTSGRDSLFQAEARRCKEIVDCVDMHHSCKTHLCVFDELYSGTNPEEAITSAHALMKYLVEHKNVTCLLTTHYIQLCKKLSKNKKIKNYHMNTDSTNKYTYKLEEGISKIKGGIKVLHDLKYPQRILDLANKDKIVNSEYS